MKGIEGPDRRLLERFTVKAFALVQAVTPGAEKVFELYTQDISSGGAFFPMEVPLPTGEKVKITLFLSVSTFRQLQDFSNAAKIATEGHVVRSDKNGMAVEFAGRYTMSPASL